SVVIFCASFGIAFSVARRHADATAMAPETLASMGAQRAGLAVENEPRGKQAIFFWTLIDSPSHVELITNLRAIHCPEATIGDIIRARLRAEYAPKFARIAAVGNFADFSSDVRRRIRDRQALEQEIDLVMYDQLKIK